MVEFQRSLQYETGLRHGALCCVNQQNHAADHLENALHLAAKVGVSGGVDDVDLGILIVYGGVLCKNGNAALLFKRARVHNAGHGFLVIAVNAALLQKTVDKGSFTVVNVRDDCNVSQIVSDHFNLPSSNFGIIRYHIHYTIYFAQKTEVKS